MFTIAFLKDNRFNLKQVFRAFDTDASGDVDKVSGAHGAIHMGVYMGLHMGVHMGTHIGVQVGMVNAHPCTPVHAQESALRL